MLEIRRCSDVVGYLRRAISYLQHERNVMNELSILNESAIKAELEHRREVLAVSNGRRTRRFRRAAR